MHPLHDLFERPVWKLMRVFPYGSLSLLGYYHEQGTNPERIMLYPTTHELKIPMIPRDYIHILRTHLYETN